MGAALTYARRYALFTLVGIAGEEDLDAPDLTTPTNQISSTARPEGGNSSERGNGRLNGGRRDHAPTVASRRDQKVRLPSPMLAAEPSAELRDRLIAELNELHSSDGAAMWAQRRLSEKNKLTAADARQVEDAFSAQLAALPLDESEPIPALPPEPGIRPRRLKPGSRGNSPRPVRKRRPETIDKSMLTFPEPRRIRDRDHIRFVAKQTCLICGRQPSDAHHLRFAQSSALGRKVSDEFTVPLCRGHHREVHGCGDEPTWWLKVRINPMVKARELWLTTHPLPLEGDTRPTAE
jgi:hypothetical protein